MREVLVALFQSAGVPEASAFPLLNDVYLTMHPHNIEALLAQRGRHRLYAGFCGWAPGQLEAELDAGGWHVLPASADVLFRTDPTGLWEELLKKARARLVYSFP